MKGEINLGNQAIYKTPERTINNLKKTFAKSLIFNEASNIDIFETLKKYESGEIDIYYLKCFGYDKLHHTILDCIDSVEILFPKTSSTKFQEIVNSPEVHEVSIKAILAYMKVTLIIHNERNFTNKLKTNLKLLNIKPQELRSPEMLAVAENLLMQVAREGNYDSEALAPNSSQDAKEKFTARMVEDHFKFNRNASHRTETIISLFNFEKYRPAALLGLIMGFKHQKHNSEKDIAKYLDKSNIVQIVNNMNSSNRDHFVERILDNMKLTSLSTFTKSAVMKNGLVSSVKIEELRALEIETRKQAIKSSEDAIQLFCELLKECGLDKLSERIK